MKRSIAILVVVVLAAVTALVASLAGPSSAARVRTVKFHAFLNGAQEAPPTDSTAFGVAHLTLRRSKFCFEIAYSPLTSPPELFAHIHDGARGTDGPILLTLPASNPKLGCATVNSAFVSKLKAGSLYINIHGTGVPEVDGEIRGQIVRS